MLPWLSGARYEREHDFSEVKIRMAEAALEWILHALGMRSASVKKNLEKDTPARGEYD
jgi:hypothetical protein